MEPVFSTFAYGDTGNKSCYYNRLIINLNKFDKDNKNITMGEVEKQ